MAIAGHYEPRKRKQRKAPDYEAIYSYIAELLQGEVPDIAQLQPIGNRAFLFLCVASKARTIDLVTMAKYFSAATHRGGGGGHLES